MVREQWGEGSGTSLGYVQLVMEYERSQAAVIPWHAPLGIPFDFKHIICLKVTYETALPEWEFCVAIGERDLKTACL